jgi:transposase
MTSLIVGIDVGAATLVAAAGTRGGKPARLGSFANAPEHFEALGAAIRASAQAHGAAEIGIVMEPTGGYELLFAHYGLRQGWKVSLPNPKRVRDWAKGVGIRGKADGIDALKLTRFGLEQDPPAWQPLPENVAELNTLLERRHDLAGMLRQEQNRRHALRAQDAYRGPAAESLDKTIAWLEQALQEIDEAIARHLEEHPEIKQQIRRLRQVPGVGPRNAPFLFVLLMRWGVLTAYQGSAKGLTAYIGLDPQPNESGKSVWAPAHISRQGDRVTRALLFMGALGGLRGKSVLRDFYERLVARGKRKKVALLAATRKILVWAWAVFRDQVDFDPRRAGSQDPSPVHA